MPENLDVFQVVIDVVNIAAEKSTDNEMLKGFNTVILFTKSFREIYNVHDKEGPLEMPVIAEKLLKKTGLGPLELSECFHGWEYILNKIEKMSNDKEEEGSENA